MNILIVGVGGQGTLLASRVIGSAAIASGMDVKVSEVHGMSQRGGSVVTYVRYAKEPVQSPIIEHGQADYILAFEALEALRSLPYLKDGGEVIVNTQQIDPMPVITGQAIYPEDMSERINTTCAAKNAKAEMMDAVLLAKQAENERAVNIVLIGRLSAKTDIDIQVWEDAIKANSKPQFYDSNIRAFRLGRGE